MSKTSELNQVSTEALQAQIEDMRREYFTKRENVLTGKEGNSAQLRVLRRDIARAKTVLQAKKAEKQA